VLTTFHAVRDLPVALLGILRRIASANFLIWEAGEGEMERRVLTTCDETESCIQLAIIMY
jgi:hypothetical protein